MKNIAISKFDNEGNITPVLVPKIQGYSNFQNIMRALTTWSDTHAIYGVFGKEATLNGKQFLQSTTKLPMIPIGSTTVDGQVYDGYEAPFPSQVLTRLIDKGIQSVGFQLVAYDLSNETHLGISFYPDATTEQEIISELDAEYHNAVDGDYVRVINTDTDFVYDGTNWSDTESIQSHGVEEYRSSIQGFPLEGSYEGGAPQSDPDATELIINQLKEALLRNGSRQLTADWGVGGFNIENVGELASQIINTYQITSVAQAVEVLKQLNMTNNKITNLANGTNATDAVNKSQLDTKLFKSGSNADPDISINGTTFNHNRATDAIEGAEFDARATTVDNRFNSVEGNIDDIYDLLDLDGDL